MNGSDGSRSGRLAFRHAPPAQEPALEEVQHGLAAHGDGALVYVPVPAVPNWLVVMLHGAGGRPQHAIDLLRPVADEYGLLLVAPKSTTATWDVIASNYGPDVRMIDTLLDEVTARHPVSRLAVGGFSDGASYAASLGIANGDVFEAVVAFSPGFAAPQVQNGRPRFFISHGTDDAVLPVDQCGRRLARSLAASGYPVTYEEFAGPHTVPPQIARRAATWLTGS